MLLPPRKELIESNLSMAPPATAALAPAISLPECASFDLTVARHLPQLKDFLSNLIQALSSSNLLQFYLSTNPLVTACAFALGISPIFLVISEINKNYSQIDRCWSLLPPLYVAHYTAWAHLTGLPTLKLDLALGAISLWSIRLTFNYWRKGGYSVGSEDYRWDVLRTYINAPLFFVFNVVFISLLQNVLLFLVTTPAYVLLLASRVDGNTLNTSDMLYAALIVGMVLASAVADQQQWNFQEMKKAYRQTAKAPSGYDLSDLDRGFNVRGLYAWSRHPNFAFEQGVWLSLYLWSSYATQTYFNWSFTGAMAYMFLFQASTAFTEFITARKYSEYSEYQKKVSKFLPKFTSLFGGPEPMGKFSPSTKKESGKGRKKA